MLLTNNRSLEIMVSDKEHCGDCRCVIDSWCVHDKKQCSIFGVSLKEDGDDFLRCKRCKKMFQAKKEKV
ncbi:MAG TPA: hypothetical protein VKO61_01445 [Candidatus Paceibacterota bacterium]|nr:hypothetical protein [Candidatus Paceibacterota bacterium]